MRPLESALIALDLAIILLFAVSRLRPGRRRAIEAVVASLALATAFAQFTVEGFRWQLGPAYVVTAGAAGVVLLRVVPRRTRPPDAGWITPVTVVTATLLTALSLLAAALLPVPSLPRPSGSHAVGTVTFDWVDRSRTDPLAPIPRGRELMVQVWYPAAGGAAGRRAPYMSIPTLRALAGLLKLPPPSLDYLALIQTDAVEGAHPDGSAGPYPLLLFSSGLGSYRTQSTFLMEDLASRGYIVASADYPYESAAVVLGDGRVVLPRLAIPPGISPAEDRYKAGLVATRVADTGFIISRFAALDADPRSPFAGRIDMTRIGMLGHSLGGATAVAACAELAPVRACLNMDGELRGSYPDLDRPVLTMKTTNEEYGNALDRERQLTRDATLEQTPLRAERYDVTIAGPGHLNFTDIQFLVNPLVHVGSIGSIGPRRCASIIDAYVAAFFDRTLRDSSAGLLAGPSAAFPEVRVEARGPA